MDYRNMDAGALWRLDKVMLQKLRLQGRRNDSLRTQIEVLEKEYSNVGWYGASGEGLSYKGDVGELYNTYRENIQRLKKEHSFGIVRWHLLSDEMSEVYREQRNRRSDAPTPSDKDIVRDNDYNIRRRFAKLYKQLNHGFELIMNRTLSDDEMLVWIDLFTEMLSIKKGMKI